MASKDVNALWEEMAAGKAAAIFGLFIFFYFHLLKALDLWDWMLKILGANVIFYLFVLLASGFACSQEADKQPNNCATRKK